VADGPGQNRGTYGHCGGKRGKEKTKVAAGGRVCCRSSTAVGCRAVGCSIASRGERNHEKNPVLGEPKTLSAEPLNKSYGVLVFSSI